MTINVEQDRVRLDKYVAESTEYSRNIVAKMLDEELILVNGEVKTGKSKVNSGDVITIVGQLANDEIELVAQNLNLNIVYEDDELLVVDKPSNMVVHPAPGHPDKTLVNGLLYHVENLSTSEESVRPGIVHRIDKDTSGLLMVAKNDQAHAFLADQLRDKTSTRKYIALVHGLIVEDEATIDAPIGRDQNFRQKMEVTSKNSKQAVTHIKVLRRFINYTLVECRLETGRTHQIRVHLNYIKHPVVGDPVYGPKKTIDTKGQALHAAELGFVHPVSKEFISFSSDLPPEFNETLKLVEETDGYN